MNIIILGGSAAGMSFAAKYKRNHPNNNVTVIEKRDYISFGACGLPYFVADKFSDTERMISRSPKQAIESGLDIRLNTEVIDLNKTEQTVTVRHKNKEQSLHYDQLIIATGARPIIPDLGQYNTKQVYTLTSMEDGIAVKKAMQDSSKPNVAIIGAGFIGLEMFDAAHDLRKNVTLIEREKHILSRQFSPEMTQDVENAIRQTDANLLLNTQVNNITNNKDGYTITTNNGEITANIIILALGFKPNTEFVELPKMANGALLVDQFGATQDPNIYAVGDCASVHHLTLDKPVYIPLATTANKQARMMADKLSGKDTYLSGFLGSSSLKVLDYELASTGISQWLAEQHQISVNTSVINDKNQTDYYPGQEDIKIKLVYHPESNVLLGGEIVGKKGAVGRLNALAVAITAKMTTQQLGYLDFSYAPPFARTWDALNVAGNVAK
ncbi:CoA-disulfide reductase [Aliivibrio fischeri]|uniref:CoA-disulfide reductase n=1 Tax=Aliivibrio fischeri TaxID=668 RepID=UPI0007C524C0|nr:CoA-disulfide reductase [Aliivibrio fischeri]MUL01248.1 CoA-disulfide reductase [Aliivibrio fischeri]